MWNNTRVIAHLDMDAYFASVEQRSNPLIRGRPVIVTGKGKRTVIATASYEAREYGIETGMTVAQAKRLCPHVIRVVGNPGKYLYTTLRIREALLHLTDRVELYSIDEFFLDITHSQSIFGSPERIAEKIKDKVRKATGLTCSCGLASNKLLAKLASEMSKPDGLTIIHPEKAADTLNDLPVEKLHGIGEKTKKYLNRLGITKANELGSVPLSLLTSHFGFWGHILRAMGKGIDNSPVPYYWEQDEIKSIGHSYTLPFDTSEPELIKSYILMLCQKVATRLLEQGKAARTVVLTIRYNDFRMFSHQKTVSYFVDTVYGIYHVCLKILQNIELAKPVRLLGVSVTSLAEESKQLYLFEKFEKEKKLNKAIGEINNRFGDFTIKPASLLLVEKSEHLPGNAYQEQLPPRLQSRH
jgi:DNA polymerase-4